jgi:hypothetical protein
MTMYQQNLLETAHEYWDRGAVIPLTLFSKLAAEGMDVVALEAKHQKEL